MKTRSAHTSVLRLQLFAALVVLAPVTEVRAADNFKCEDKLKCDDRNHGFCGDGICQRPFESKDYDKTYCEDCWAPETPLIWCDRPDSADYCGDNICNEPWEDASGAPETDCIDCYGIRAKKADPSVN